MIMIMIIIIMIMIIIIMIMITIIVTMIIVIMIMIMTGGGGGKTVVQRRSVMGIPCASRPETLPSLSILGFWLSHEGLPSIKIVVLTSRFQIHFLLRSNLARKRSGSVALSNLMFINLKCYDFTMSESEN